MIPQAREPSALAINSRSRCKPCDINATSDSVNMTLYKYPNESWLNGQKKHRMENRAENGKHKNLCNIIYLKNVLKNARNNIFYVILNIFKKKLSISFYLLRK